MKTISLFIFVLTFTLGGCTKTISYAVTSEQEQLWTEQYNKQYIDQDFVKTNPKVIVLINNYYDCKKGKESAIEGCIAHVSKSNYDTTLINEYLTGLAKYISESKNK